MNHNIALETFLWPFLISLFISFLVTPIVIKFAWRLGIVDDPQKKKHTKNTHTYPVPRGGGLPILIAIIITCLFFLPLDKHLSGIILGVIFTGIVGLIDDRYDLSPYLRIFTCFIAAAIVVGSGIGIASINNPLGGVIDLSQPQINISLLGQERTLWIIADLFAIIWIGWCMNFIGWSGGIEGQLPGFVAIAAATIGIFSLRYSADITQWPVIILAAVTAGAYLGFLPFNFFPQKIMPGYSGKSIAGFLLAVLSILATAKIGTLVVVLGIPLADALYAVLRRIKSGHSPFWGDRGHLHHYLLDLGWSKRRVAVFYWVVTAILGMLALNLGPKQKFYALIMVILILGGFLLWVNYLRTLLSRPDRNNG